MNPTSVHTDMSTCTHTQIHMMVGTVPSPNRRWVPHTENHGHHAPHANTRPLSAPAHGTSGTAWIFQASTSLGHSVTYSQAGNTAATPYPAVGGQPTEAQIK